MPDWVAEQIDMSDYVKLLQAPVGTWNGETYRVSIDADAHNFNFRSDIFSNEELGAEWTASGGSEEWGPPQTWQQVQAVTQFLNGKQIGRRGPLRHSRRLRARGRIQLVLLCQPGHRLREASGQQGLAVRSGDMTPYVNNEAFVRAAQDIIDALPLSRPIRSMPTSTEPAVEQFLAGIGSMVHWWGDVGSYVYTSDLVRGSGQGHVQHPAWLRRRV